MLELTLSDIYNENDLAETPIFSGGLINFGYWKNINLQQTPLSIKERTQSSKDLYDYVIDKLALSPQNKVLEVGSGRGYGARSAIDRVPGIQMVAMDLFVKQINKAAQAQKEVVESKQNFILVRGEAENIPFPDNYFHKIFSVEAAQHFESIENFFKEAFRVLKPNGNLVLTTFFCSNDHVTQAMREKFPYFEQGLDHFIPINYLTDFMAKIGFIDIECESIGEHVWHGFDQWLAQTVHEGQWGSWSRNWLKAYREGLVDYYVISAVKPA